MSYMALNNSNPLFSGNARLRRAVSFAINRSAMVAQYGVFGGIPADQVLAAARSGRQARSDLSEPAEPQSGTPAREVRPRNRRGILYHLLTAPGPRVAGLVRNSLRSIGIDMETRGYRGFAIYRKAPAGVVRICGNGGHRLVQGLPGSVRLHQRAAVRRESRRRTTTTSPTSATRRTTAA